jgi:histidinol-phosphate phosphatase family protein
MRRKLRARPIVFLDRDGTLIEERGYLRDPRKVKLLPSVIEGLKRLRTHRLAAVVISNQSGVARGLISRREVKAVNGRLLALLRRGGARVDGLFWCPHGPEDHCPCRKPKLGLLKRAARELRLPWRRSISVGDRWGDVAIGRRTGGRGVLVLTGYGRQAAREKRPVRADFIARDFEAAVRWILKERESLA